MSEQTPMSEKSDSTEQPDTAPELYAVEFSSFAVAGMEDIPITLNDNVEFQLIKALYQRIVALEKRVAELEGGAATTAPDHRPQPLFASQPLSNEQWRAIYAILADVGEEGGTE